MPVPVEEELRRVLPVIEALSPQVRVSVDTVKEAVAEAAVAAGATLVNDVSASLWPVAARHGVGWVAMHRKGTPGHHAGRSPLRRRGGRGARPAGRAGRRGLGGRGRRDLDRPGHRVREDRWTTTSSSWPASTPWWPAATRSWSGPAARRSSGVLAAGPDGARLRSGDRLPGSLATATWALQQGAGMVRVHDVAATVQAALLVGRPRRLRTRVAGATDTEVGS